MRLLRLEASGFKSFCDKTVINFVQNGISVVVGPNGCGKSNIVDAVRWTLGEQSAKHLRGTSMEDVIFSGSSARQPVSMAQVSLIFSNPRNDTIPKYSEFNEIAITRRLYRSGESQYLINKTACRLTDIRELFMDTGIGGKGYSIIEQGKIDQIITSRAEDRRLIIDEAAGIVKFKTKRKEAERKFAATKQNLMRVEDVLAELERQEETLVVQVERAEEYLTAKSRLERLQHCIAATKWYRLKDQADRTSQSHEKAIEQKKDLEAATANLEAQESTLSLQITQEESDLNAVKTEIQQQKEAIIKLESRLDSDKLTLENLDEWDRKNQEEKELIEKQIKTIKLQLETYQAEHKKLEEEVREKSSLLESLQNTADSSDADLSSQKIRLSNLQQKEVESITAVVAEQNQLVQLQERIKEVEQKTTELEAREKNSESEEKDLHQSWLQLETAIKEKKKEKLSCQETIQLHSKQAEELEAELEKMRQTSRSIQQEITQADSKLESLRELILSHDEYDAATKNVLDTFTSEPKLTRDLGYLGTLAELVDLPDPLTPQITSFLNRYYNVLVFQSIARLKEIVAFSHQHDLEQFQAVFLDFADRKTKPAAEEILQTNLQEQGTPGTMPIVDRFKLIDTPLDQLDPDQLKNDDGLIDTESSMLTREGIFFIGQPGKSNLAESLVKRRQQISHIESSLTELHDKLEKNDEKLEERSSHLEELSRMLKSVQQDVVDLDLEIVGLEKEFDSKSLEKQRFEAIKNGIETEKTQLKQINSDFQQKIKDLEASIKDNQQKQETIRKVCDELKSQIEKTESQKEEAASELQHIKVVLAGIEEKQQNQSQGIERMSGELKERQQQMDDILKRSGETENKRQAIESSLARANQDLPKLVEEVAVKEKQQKGMSDALESKRIRYQKIKEDYKKETQSMSGINDKIHKTEIKLAQLAQEARNIEDNLFAEDALKPEELIQTFDVKSFNIEKETETIAELKKQIGGMSDINLAAKSEYETLKERLDFLRSQSRDLTQSMEALETSINKINQESRKRFRTTFQQVNEQFNKLFPDLFGGGEAYLKLTDEDDILESGVEIIAQPPGKKLQNMTLLSGGEKALTAIALIFAVFMIKPSPFCLLDEVDAPLDDANNVRFNRHVRELTENSQFIIITHNKKTMEIGDALFGVTMEEPGISKVVSVDFSKFDPDSLQKAI